MKTSSDITKFSLDPANTSKGIQEILLSYLKVNLTGIRRKEELNQARSWSPDSRNYPVDGTRLVLWSSEIDFILNTLRGWKTIEIKYFHYLWNKKQNFTPNQAKS